jgi:hypothetical protein
MQIAQGETLVKQLYFHSVNGTALLEGAVGHLRGELPPRRGRGVFRYRTMYGIRLQVLENWSET